MNFILFYFIMLYFGEEQNLIQFCMSHILCSHSFTSHHITPRRYVWSCSTSVPTARVLHWPPLSNNATNSSKRFPCCWHLTKITFSCILHHNRNQKHMVLASLWQHKFAARHVVSVVQSGAPKTWHSCQLSWKPIDLFRTLKMSTRSNVTSEP